MPFISIFIRKRYINLRSLKIKKNKRSVNIYIYKTLLFSFIVIFWDIILFLSAINSNIFTTQYLSNYQISIVLSVILLVLLNYTSFLRYKHPRKYRKYSIFEYKRLLFSSVLSFLILINWSFTTVISYDLGDGFYVIRDTFPSFIPLMLISIILLIIKTIDLTSNHIYKEDYRRILIAHEKKTKQDLKNINRNKS